MQISKKRANKNCPRIILKDKVFGGVGVGKLINQERLMIEEPIHVTDLAFKKTILQSPIPVIVDFWAPWCGPCKSVAPMLERIAKEYAGQLIVAKINTDENPENAMKNEVQGIPTMLFMANGKVIHRQVGALPEASLRMAVEQFLEVTHTTK